MPTSSGRLEPLIIAGNEKELADFIRDLYNKFHGIGMKHNTHHVETTEADPFPLIVDHHMSHCSLDAVTVCTESHIILLSLPPRSSRKVQQLDRRLLGHLKMCMLLKLPNDTHPPRACSSTVTTASFSEIRLQNLLI